MDIDYEKISYLMKSEEIMSEIVYGNKYFYHHELLDYFLSKVNENIEILNKGSVLYRARLDNGSLDEKTYVKLIIHETNMFEYSDYLSELTEERKQHNENVKQHSHWFLKW